MHWREVPPISNFLASTYDSGVIVSVLVHTLTVTISFWTLHDHLPRMFLYLSYLELSTQTEDYSVRE